MLGAGTWSGITFALLGVASLAVAALVRSAAPRTRQNTLLAATLGVHGLYQLLFGLWSAHHWGLTFLPDGALRWMVSLSVVAATASAAVYLLFVGAALESRMVRWLRAAWVPWLLAGGVALFAAFWFGLGDALFVAGRQWAPGYYLGGLASVLALAASVRLLRSTAPGTAERRRAVAFVVAFGARNLLLLRVLLQATAEDVFGVVLLFGPVSWYEGWNYDLWQDVVLDGVFLSVLSYGVLTGQLVTLDDRIKRTIQHAAVVAAVSTVFIVATEGVEELLGFDSAVLGIAAAVLVSFLFLPIQTLAERVARRLVPSADSLRSMGRDERAALYAEQCAIAWGDGEVTAKERRMLERLQDLLRLDAAECERVEARLRAADAAGTAGAAQASDATQDPAPPAATEPTARA